MRGDGVVGGGEGEEANPAFARDDQGLASYFFASLSLTHLLGNMSTPSTRGGAKRGGARGGGGKSSGGGGGRRYSSKRPVGGRGIFVTCIRGKESRAQAEVLDLLDEVRPAVLQPALGAHSLLFAFPHQVADRIYPAERVAELEQVRAHRIATLQAEQGEVPAVEDDGEPSSEEDESIEASIARELEELKSAGKKGKGKADGKPKGPKPRFQGVETNTECREPCRPLRLCYCALLLTADPSTVLFIAVSWPYDPVELVETIVRDIQDTAVGHTRFGALSLTFPHLYRSADLYPSSCSYTQRLSPCAISCHAPNEEQVNRESEEYIEKYFADYAQRTGKTEMTVRVS